ncbi:MAG: biosynthetic-type acetolactate synthase large subunit [Lachnospiraceae bacterium]
MQITGAELFVKALLAEQVDTLFAYPGGQAIDLFNALYGVSGLRVVLPRHEQGLVHAADGYARSTGKVGVCLVTSGPGATNLVTGIATANYDSVPMVCFTGQVPTGLIGNDAFQEVDIVGITRSITKYAVTVRRRENLAAVIKKAFYIARTGKPGVVVVDLPKDIQQEPGSDCYPKQVEIRGYKPNTRVHMGQIGKSLECLKRAKRPVFLLGGGVKIAHAGREMTALMEKTGIPAVTTIMGKGTVPTDHPLYVGNLGIHGSYAANTAISRCDVLFSIGVRFNDRITGKVSEFAKDAVIIHVDIDPASISRNIEVDIPIVADAENAVQVLLENAFVCDCEDWRNQIDLWKKEHPLAVSETVHSETGKILSEAGKTGVTPQAVMGEINRIFERAVITTDVGQNQLWATQFLELSEEKQMLTSGGLGTMGYGLPAALGAKLGNPDRDVIAICGDGGIQMNIQEMATAVVYELPVIICILNNGYLGNVRQWQEMFFDRRYSCTCLRRRKSCPAACSTPSSRCPAYTPDFIRLAESYGAKAIRVTKREEIKAALEEAKNTPGVPTVIEFLIEPEENVLPIVPPGNPLSSMIMGGDDDDEKTMDQPVCGE